MDPLAKIFNDLVTKGFEFFGRYYSSYRGFVVDNEDPESYGRVKVKVPQVYGSQTMDYWAWPKGCFSGKGYGIQVTAQKGEMIYVEFEFGDPRKPIWSFGHFGKDTDGNKEKPDELKDIGNFWFKTPGGNIVEFDDTNKLIRVKTEKGYYVELNDTGISLVGDKVSLIELDGANEPAVLGDKNEDTLKAINDALGYIKDYLQNISTADTAAIATIASVTGGLLTYNVQAATTLVQLLPKLTDIQTKISQTKSQKVTLS